MTKQQEIIDWQEILTTAGPYPLEAFAFVREGLNYTVDHVHEDPEELAEMDRHISGQFLQERSFLGVFPPLQPI